MLGLGLGLDLGLGLGFRLKLALGFGLGLVFLVVFGNYHNHNLAFPRPQNIKIFLVLFGRFCQFLVIITTPRLQKWQAWKLHYHPFSPL